MVCFRTRENKVLCSLTFHDNSRQVDAKNPRGVLSLNIGNGKYYYNTHNDNTEHCFRTRKVLEPRGLCFSKSIFGIFKVGYNFHCLFLAQKYIRPEKFLVNEYFQFELELKTR